MTEGMARMEDLIKKALKLGWEIVDDMLAPPRRIALFLPFSELETVLYDGRKLRIPEKLVEKSYLYLGKLFPTFVCPESEQRINRALLIGWTICDLHGDEYYMLVPPPKYECKEWAATWTSKPYRGILVSIPHWFNEDDVLYVGTRL